MHEINILPNIGAAITLALGILGLLSPASAAKLVGIQPDGVLGVSEIRATYGGLFIGLSVAASTAGFFGSRTGVARRSMRKITFCSVGSQPIRQERGRDCAGGGYWGATACGSALTD
jgi:hypothetical protein